jgi:hypothetical protein
MMKKDTLASNKSRPMTSAGEKFPSASDIKFPLYVASSGRYVPSGGNQERAKFT